MSAMNYTNWDDVMLRVWEDKLYGMDQTFNVTFAVHKVWCEQGRREDEAEPIMPGLWR